MRLLSDVTKGKQRHFTEALHVVFFQGMYRTKQYCSLGKNLSEKQVLYIFFSELET